MDELTVLLTGDYWHADFIELIARAPFPVTLRSIDSILADTEADRNYRLVVVASSRRGQFEVARLERMMNQFVNVPTVALLGSWCEGEERSGDPVAGLIRVYWHQWQGRIDRFVDCIGSGQVSSWQLPKIVSPVDRTIQDVQSTIKIPNIAGAVGVSSQTEEAFLTLRDGMASTGRESIWLEKIEESELGIPNLSVVCVEANSLTEWTQKRVVDLQKQFLHTPIVLILNFPRRAEYEIAARLGITEIVSKPFQLHDLHSALRRTISEPAA